MNRLNLWEIMDSNDYSSPITCFIGMCQTTAPRLAERRSTPGGLP